MYLAFFKYQKLVQSYVLFFSQKDSVRREDFLTALLQEL